MCDEVTNNLREALISEKASSIDRMEPARRVAVSNIVQCRRYYQIRTKVRLSQHRE